MTKINLRDEALKAAGFDKPEYTKSWVRFVDSINPNGAGFYSFNGDFVPYGMAEPPRKIKILLCAGKSSIYFYKFFTVDPTGLVLVPHIEGSTRVPHWASKVKQEVEKLIIRVNHENNLAAVTNKIADVTKQPVDDINFTEYRQTIETLGGNFLKRIEDNFYTETDDSLAPSLKRATTEDLIFELEQRGFTCIPQTPKIDKKNVHVMPSDGIFRLYVNGICWCTFADENLSNTLTEMAYISDDMFQFYIRTFRLGVTVNEHE